MLRLASFVAVLGTILLSGCTTGYQKLNALSYTGGFKDQSLGQNVHRVVFSANGFTTAETAQCFWLYRCAELTLEQGFDGFEVLSDIRLTWNLPPEQAFVMDAPRAELAQYYVPIFIPTDDSHKPHIEADILLLKAPVEAKPPRVFDAQLLKEALEPHVTDPIKSRRNVKPHVHDYLLPAGKLEGTH